MPERQAMTYCIVPADLAGKLHALLRKHFADRGVEVVVERRGADRRGVHERRAGPAGDYGERRRVRNPAGRRVADRRRSVLAVAPPELPLRARRHADRLVFIERLVPTTEEAEDVDIARLVTRIQAGDPDGTLFGEVYMRYFDRVFAYLQVVARDTHAAEDLTQQAFLQVFEAMPRYERRRQPFRAWLFVIVRNTMLKELSKHNRLELVEPRALEVEHERDRAHEGSMDLDALRWITDSDLMLFIERLPQIQRQVLLLRYMLDLPATQVAKILDRSPADVRKIQERALRFLRQRLVALDDAGDRRRRGRIPIRRRATFLGVARARRFALHP